MSCFLFQSSRWSMGSTVIISPMSLDGWWVFVSAWQREKEMDTAVAVEDKTTTPERNNPCPLHHYHRSSSLQNLQHHPLPRNYEGLYTP